MELIYSESNPVSPGRPGQASPWSGTTGDVLANSYFGEYAWKILGQMYLGKAILLLSVNSLYRIEIN